MIQQLITRAVEEEVEEDIDGIGGMEKRKERRRRRNYEEIGQEQATKTKSTTS